MYTFKKNLSKSLTKKQTVFGFIIWEMITLKKLFIWELNLQRIPMDCLSCSEAQANKIVNLKIMRNYHTGLVHILRFAEEGEFYTVEPKV